MPKEKHEASVKCVLLLFDLRTPGCSPPAEERVQRGAGEVTGQYEGHSEWLPAGLKFMHFKLHMSSFDSLLR